jgi:hypothetical protein
MIFSVLLKREPSQAEKNGEKRGEQDALDGRGGSKESGSHHVTLVDPSGTPPRGYELGST